MGALFAGVFCGVLCQQINQWSPTWYTLRAYGAVGRSNFLLRMGSDILQKQQGMQDKDPGDEGAEYVGMEEILEDQKISIAWVYLWSSTNADFSEPR